MAVFVGSNTLVKRDAYAYGYFNADLDLRPSTYLGFKSNYGAIQAVTTTVPDECPECPPCSDEGGILMPTSGQIFPKNLL